MPLLNYTTEIDVERTVSEIQKMLATHGASAILTEYEDGYVKAISFKITVSGNSVGFRLPTDWRPVMAILEKQRMEYRRKGKRWNVAVDQTQAVRVAWRIVKDWIEAQMAIIDTRMVNIEDVFLPYAVTQSGKTLAETFKEGGNLLGSGI